MADRLVVATAVTAYARAPELDRPELVDDVDRVVGLLTRPEFGYKQVAAVGMNPTALQLRDELRRFCKAEARSEDDYIVIYIACHGDILEGDEFVLLPSDVETSDLFDRAVRPQELVDRVLRGTKVRKLLLLIDACYSGQGGSGAAQAAARWANQSQTTSRPGVLIVTATRPWEAARPGAFTTALLRAVDHLATGGHAQQDLPIDAIVEVMNSDREKPPSQSVTYHQLGTEGRAPDFLRNPRYRRTLIDVDLLEQERSSFAEQREAHLRERFQPATKWFTGRHSAIRTLGEWLAGGGGTERPIVVTGRAGSGKTAVLGLVAALSDPDRSGTIPRDGLPDAANYFSEQIDEAIYTGTMTTDQIRDRIAAAAGLNVQSVHQLVNGLRPDALSSPRPLVIIVDAIDEAADPPGLITSLLNPLIRYCSRSVRLLLGTRPHLLSKKLIGAVESNKCIVVDLDSEQYADPDSINTYVRRILTSDDALDSHYQPSGIYLRAPSAFVDRVSSAISEAAGLSFLIARITATTETTSTELPNPADREWRASLPRRAGDAMRRDLRIRLGEDAAKAAELLTPLAYAQGAGFPWEDLWPKLANALSPGRNYTNDDLLWLRRAAGSYAVEGLSRNRSVYRLYHQALVEHLRDGRDPVADHHRVTNVLLTHVPWLTDSRRDWVRAHPYIRDFLSSHAAAAGEIDDILVDPGFLLHVSRPQLLGALDEVRSPKARAIAGSYRRAIPRLRSRPDAEHASYLQLAARIGGAFDLARELDDYRPPHSWSSLWASYSLETPHQALEGHGGPVRALVVTELAGRVLLTSGGDDGFIRRFEPASGASLPLMPGHPGGVTALAIGEVAGGTVLASGGEDGIVRLWDLATGTFLEKFDVGRLGQHMSEVAGLEFARVAGTVMLVAFTGDGRIRIWKFDRPDRTAEALLTYMRTVPGLSKAYTLVPDDESLIIAVASSTQLEMYNLLTGRGVGPTRQSTGEIISLTASDWDGRPALLIGYRGGHVLLYSIEDGESLHTTAPVEPDGTYVVCLGELAEQPVVISGNDRGDVFVCRPGRGRPTEPLKGHTGPVRAIAFGEIDGRPVAFSAGNDATIRVWELPPRAPVDHDVVAHRKSAEAVATGRLGDREVLITAGSDMKIRVWEAATGRPIEPVFPAPGEDVLALTLARRGGDQVILAVHSDGTVMAHRFDAADTPARVALPISGSGLTAATFTEIEGRLSLVASSSEPSAITIYDIAGGAVRTIPVDDGHGAVTALATGVVDGRLVVASGHDGAAVRVWDVDDDLVGRTVADSPTSATAIALVNIDGGSYLLSASRQAGLHLATVQSSGTAYSLAVDFSHSQDIQALELTYVDKQQVVVVGDDSGHVIVRELRLQPISSDHQARHDGRVVSAAFSVLSGVSAVVTGDDERSIVVREGDGGSVLHEMSARDSRGARALCPVDAPGQETILFLGNDGIGRMWDLTTGGIVGPPLFGLKSGLQSIVSSTMNGRPVVYVGEDSGIVRAVQLGATIHSDRRVFHGQRSPVKTLLLTTGEGIELLVSGAMDGSIIVWETMTGRRVKATTSVENSGGVRTMCQVTSGGARFLVYGTGDGSVWAWRLDRKPALRQRMAGKWWHAPRQEREQDDDRGMVRDGLPPGDDPFRLHHGRSPGSDNFEKTAVSGVAALQGGTVAVGVGSSIHFRTLRPDTEPTTTIELDSQVFCLAADERKLVVGTKLGILALEGPLQF